MKFIIGKKQEMTQIWQEDRVVAVTKVQAGPCQITQLKDIFKDGYEAVQMAYGERKVKNVKKPQIKHLQKAKIDTSGKTTFHYLREFRGQDITQGIELGDIVKVDTFAAGDKIQVTGISKGKGFQGVVKRHGFHGTNAQHGNKDQSRMPGSIGATGPAHVFKGTRMGGRTGGDRVTMRTLEIIQVDIENNILFVKGGIPGARNGLILISGEGELKTVKAEKVTVSKNDKQKTVDNKKLTENEQKQAKAKDIAVKTSEQVEKEVVKAKEKVESKKDKKNKQ